MPAPDQPPVALSRVGGGGTGARAWIAGLGLVAGLAGLVVLGAIGGGEERPAPARTPGPTHVAGQVASAPAAESGATTAPEPTQASPSARIVNLSRAGYVVRYPRDASHRPIIFDGGALAIFGYGERVPDGAYPGIVRVAVGTPARAATVPGDGGTRLVFAETLSELVDEYLRDMPMGPAELSTRNEDGVSVTVLDFEPSAPGEPSMSVALVVDGGRVFVISAVGFEDLFPKAPLPSAVGLRQFLADMEFGPGLFVSREFGFQALTLADGALGSGRNGERVGGTAFIFDAGEPTATSEFPYRISVSVGSRDAPAEVRVLAGERVKPARIWAASLVELQAAYLNAIANRAGSSSTIRLGGELALLIEQPNGLAATVLAVHRGRVYIVSTTGPEREPAPGFEAFLEAFTFLDDEDGG